MIPDTYLKEFIQTATPERLVLALYDAAMVALTRAADAIETATPAAIETAHRELVRAQNIVIELRVSLDAERGGAIAAGLEALYGFCIEQLIAANLSKNAALLEPVEAVLRTLRDTWAEACCSGRAGSAGNAGNTQRAEKVAAHP